MNEREIIRGSASGVLFLWIGIACLGVSVVLGVRPGAATLSFLLIGAIPFVVFLIIFLSLRSCHIVVTNKRVYGEAQFGRRVDLPFDSISAVGRKGKLALGGIVVSTSSGRIEFAFIKNADEIHKAIGNLLIERQKSGDDRMLSHSINVSSDADELKKFKELLDNGVITIDEFEVKKKQLLGL